MPETKYIATSTELEGIADAIREKGGTSASLVYPAGFISAIDGIQAGSPSLKFGALRPDAEVVKTWSRDYHIVDDDDVTIPAYTTTATTLQATESLTSDKYSFDFDSSYDYCVIQRALVIPEYDTQTRTAGCNEYFFVCGQSELSINYKREIQSLDGTMESSVVTNSLGSMNSVSRTVSHGSTFTSGYGDLVISTSSYGVYCTLNNPTVSTSATRATFTAKTPSVLIRGNTTYMTQTFFDALTDARVQYIIQIWRAPKTEGVISGWQHKSQMDHVLSCINNNNCKLT